VDAIVAAFQGFIDYAGLYPPAGLDLGQVVRNYATYRSGPASWMLGRLIVPLDRLDEADALAKAAGATRSDPWPTSVLVGDGLGASTKSAVLTGFRSRPDVVLSAESVETSAGTVDEIAFLARSYPIYLERFIEIPADPDPAPLLAAIAGAACSAKIRTGGLTADKIPPTPIVARFLSRARQAGASVKATAGLHHAIRAERPLTYAADSPTGVMHGFVNLVFAAGLLTAGKIDEELADAVLDDDRAEVFKFGGRAGSWLNAVLTYGEFAHSRDWLLRSVGSCSFEEPVNELRALGWIAP
jgi:hypothetical protein